MSAILINETDFENIKDHLIGCRYWENMNLSYPEGYWIPANILRSVPGYGPGFMPVVEVPNLSMFFGNSPVDQLIYGENLTCLCRSREDGSTIKGISILPPYWYESQYFEFKRCFRYHAIDDSERCWQVIRYKADIDWLMGCWDAHPELCNWLGGHAWV